MSDLKRSLSLLLLCDNPALIERALEYLAMDYNLKKKHVKNFSEWKEDVLDNESLVFWSHQDDMPLKEVLKQVNGRPVFVIVDGEDLEACRTALKTKAHDVLAEARWPLLPQLLERLFKKQHRDSYLQHQQAILQTLIKENTEAIIGHNYNKITFVNASLVQLLGYTTVEELIGQPLSKVVCLEDVPAHLATQAPEKQEVLFKKVSPVRLIKKGGVYLRVGLQALVLPLGANNPVVWQIKSDENRWELLRQAISQQSALLVKHADQAPGVVYQYHFFPKDDKTNFPFVSDRLGDLTAVPVEELRKNGDLFFEYLHPEDREEFVRLGIESMKTLGKWSMDFRLLAKDGSYRWMHASSKPVRLEDGSVLWYGYMEDITDDKRAEEEIKDREKQVRTLFESAPDGIVILDREATIVRWNPKAIEIFGWEPEEVLGKKLYDVLAPERHRQVYIDSLQRFHRGEETFLHKALEMRACRKNGQEFPLLMSISDMFSMGELYFLCFFGDITKRKQAQKKLQESLKEKEVLLKEIHHRVKNNLQVITSLLSLQASFIDNPHISDIFKKSQYRINSMGMVHEMLYQSKDLAKINYQEYLERLTTSLKRAMVDAKKEIEVVLEVPGISLNVDTAVPLSLIVNELLTNAFKYAFKGRTKGQVKLTLKALEPPQYMLCILDDGVGYLEEEQKKKSPSLGLLLVRKLALQLEGSIERLEVEQGTAYRLCFKEITTNE